MAKHPKAGRSANGAAAIRAMEMFIPANKRLFDDRIVIDLLPPLPRFLLCRSWFRGKFHKLVERAAPGIPGALLCRTRCIDDMLKAAVARGIRSVAILGAGLDTRPYRLAELANASVFELDLPHVQASKRARLERLRDAPRNHVRFVPIDFNVDRLDTTLAANGFPTSEPAVFVWEGVTQYLEPSAVDAVLATIARYASRSEVIFTYVLEEVISGRFLPGRSEAFRKGASRQPEPWRFGIDPSQLEPFLAIRGLELCEDVGAGEHTARYLQPINRELMVSEIERVARARVAPQHTALVR